MILIRLIIINHFDRLFGVKISTILRKRFCRLGSKCSPFNSRLLHKCKTHPTVIELSEIWITVRTVAATTSGHYNANRPSCHAAQLLCNLFISTHMFPHHWKRWIVIPTEHCVLSWLLCLKFMKVLEFEIQFRMRFFADILNKEKTFSKSGL